ncbi:MAG: 3-isopropylmalate dehydratase small subunit [Pseudomonadota bacterium]
MPEPFICHQGIAAILMRDNVDTDQIIPSREMKSVSRSGLGEGLFAGWRYTRPDSRQPEPGFVLNQPENAGASILVSGENFGCGSSREHAVWALQEFGFRVVIAKSFGEIFHGNCIRNGILPVSLPAATVDAIADGRPPIRVKVSLETQTLSVSDKPGSEVPFELGAYPKRLLLEGLDPIALTLSKQSEIESYLRQDAESRPWVYSAA